MIVLENVSKIYPNADSPAVDNLSLHVGEGETCVLVGPSGCGKTTTMKMINRLILPTEGTIHVNGEDISTVNPIELRRNIGYVIQEIGLFPHMTIFDNIATVPKELKWPKDKIEKRVNELMELMGLDPKVHGKRRPSDLSGGQRQRVGVARAMAADPPVMLMDEPFGAVDPITRGRLQDEFLNMQQQIKKTIVFVTHDIDEALKMGTKIAVLRAGQLVQYATPDELLSKPADDFVEDLVGRDSTLKRLNLITAEEVMGQTLITVGEDASISEVREKYGDSPGSRIYVVDHKNRLLGYFPKVDLDKDGKVKSYIQPLKNTVTTYTRLSEALSELLSAGETTICVVDENDILKGVIHLQDIVDAAGKKD